MQAGALLFPWKLVLSPEKLAQNWDTAPLKLGHCRCKIAFLTLKTLPSATVGFKIGHLRIKTGQHHSWPSEQIGNTARRKSPENARMPKLLSPGASRCARANRAVWG